MPVSVVGRGGPKLEGRIVTNKMKEAIPEYAKDYPDVAQTLEQASLPFYCCNCYRKAETTWVTPNLGPFCALCLAEIPDVERIDALITALRDCLGWMPTREDCHIANLDEALALSARVRTLLGPGN